MCEKICYFLKLHIFCFLIIVLLITYIICKICKMRKKDSEEKCKCKPIFDFIKAYFIYICTLILSLLILYIFLCYNSNILNLIREGESLGLIISALITVTGVFVGFYFNKKQTYKEIVTRERIEWLHKMKEALAEYLSITSNTKVTNRFEDKKERARELYYLIISNLNVKEDKDEKNKNERDAVELLHKYANSKGLDVELNFDRNVDREEKKDSKVTKSIDELKEEKGKLIEEIKTLEDKIKNLRKSEEVDPLAGLKRKEIISKYTEIFNKTWNRIKNEAD